MKAYLKPLERYFRRVTVFSLPNTSNTRLVDCCIQFLQTWRDSLWFDHISMRRLAIFQIRFPPQHDPPNVRQTRRQWSIYRFRYSQLVSGGIIFHFKLCVKFLWQ